MIKVLMVCYGNICRSPMAEGVFQHMVNEAGLADKISVDSAGVSGYHAGEQAHIGTRNVLKKHNIPYDGRSRQLIRADLREFDYVLGMDSDNLYTIRNFGKDTPAITDFFLTDAYKQGLVAIQEVPDPYYTGKYDETYDLVWAGCQALLARIRHQKHI
jgi:protein-tyrosine phosphatase